MIVKHFENMAVSKDDIHSWIRLFNKHGIIKNYTMLKNDARLIFYKQKIGGDFGNILAALNIYKICRSTKKSELVFDKQQLDTILKVKSSTKNIMASSKPSIICKICSISFTREVDLNNHRNTSKQHYFRTLYFNDSKLLKKLCNDFIIEIEKGFGSGREILLLQSGIEATSYIHLKNVSKDTYMLNAITELHSYIKDINIVTSKLPLLLKPNTEVKLNIRSCIPEPGTKLYVHVFSFTNKTLQKDIDFLKEITLHVNAETYTDLLPTSKYRKTTRVQNNINPRISVRLDVVGPRSNYPVELDQYHVPRQLGNVLAIGLELYDGIPNEVQSYLLRIKTLLKENTSGQYLTRNNYFHLLDLLIHMEEYQLSIDIRNYDTQTKDLIKIKGFNDRYQLSVPDLAERRPSLLPGDSVYVKSVDSKTYQGVVRTINQDSVILEFNRKFTNTVYTKGINLSVAYGYSRSNIRVEHRGLDLLSQHRVLAPFFPTKVIVPSIKEYQLKWFNEKIKSNPQQQQAVLHILSRSSYPSPYLIFGPPGTGKTMTIVEAISQVWKMKSKANILVCAPSNSVANEIALRLTPYVPKSQLFRYMSVSFDMYNIPDEVLPFTNYDDGDFYSPTLIEICSYRIVISTMINAARLVSLGVPPTHFSYVFIDESGHATESETLVPIAGLITCEENAGTVLGQVILAGDPMQLGPIIHSPYARQYGYGMSMLERLMTTVDIYKRDEEGNFNPMALTKLLNNYRSHPSILYLPNKLFYDKELIPNGGDLVNIALNWEKLPNKKVPIIFHTVIGADQREANSPSYFNIQEIEIVMKYLSDLIGHRLKGRQITQKDIGVITPYRKQVQKIRKACEKKNWNEITIGSVEQFQGQERLIILISTVRSQPKLLKFDNKYHLGFLNNPKRFNVAITRAKSLVIIVGNPNLLQYETYWRLFIQYCIENNCMTGTPFQFSNKATDSLALDMAKLRIDGEPDDVVDFSRGNS